MQQTCIYTTQSYIMQMLHIAGYQKSKQSSASPGRPFIY